MLWGMYIHWSSYSIKAGKKKKKKKKKRKKIETGKTLANTYNETIFVWNQTSTL